MSQINNKQNIELAELQEWKKGFLKLYKNDLTHLKGGLDKLESKMDKVMDRLSFGFIILIAATILTQLILSIFK